MTRKRYERYGYIAHPAFESMWADNYLTWEAKKDAAEGALMLVERLDIVFEHRHPALGKGARTKPERSRTGAKLSARVRHLPKV